MKTSAGGPNKHGVCRDRQACTPQNTPVLYTLARREVHAGQRLSMPRRQSPLHERLPIRKLPQPGPYTGPYYTKAHDQHESKHQGGPRIRPNPLSGHPPSSLPEIHTGVLTQRPSKRRQVICPTGTCQHRPRGPSAHQDGLPQPRRTGGLRERQNKFKPRTTNGRSNRVTQSD